ncbi:MAG: AI-2E family transporter [Acidobacteria bacterium]|nr:AI-2E family transporter [Acidobacteriota bacterium]
MSADSGPFGLDLTKRQRATIAAALTILGVVVIVAALGLIIWVVAAFLRYFSTVFLPLAVGGVGAMVFRPYYQRLRDRLRLPMPVAVAAVFLSVLIPLGAFGWFFGALLADQITDMTTRFPGWWGRVTTQVAEGWPELREFLETNPWVIRARDALEGQSGAIVAGLQEVGLRALTAGRGLLVAITGVFSWVMVPVYFAFFLAAGGSASGDPSHYFPFLKPDTRRDVVFLLTEFMNILVAFFRGQLIIAFLQGVLFAIGFSLVGLQYGFVIGLMLGFLNIIPYLGSMIGLSVGLPLAYFQSGGGGTTAVLVLVTFVVVQAVEGYVLTPRIMGEKTGLHPMAIIVAVFFWGAAIQGILGMILAIPLTAFLVVFWRLLRDKYITELV